MGLLFHSTRNRHLKVTNELNIRHLPIYQCDYQNFKLIILYVTNNQVKFMRGGGSKQHKFSISNLAQTSSSSPSPSN